MSAASCSSSWVSRSPSVSSPSRSASATISARSRFSNSSAASSSRSCRGEGAGYLAVLLVNGKAEAIKDRFRRSRGLQRSIHGLVDRNARRLAGLRSTLTIRPTGLRTEGVRLLSRLRATLDLDQPVGRLVLMVTGTLRTTARPSVSVM